MDPEEIRTLSFGALLRKLLQDLEERSYTPLTLSNYRRTLKKIELFMVDRGILVYTPEVGIQYYKMYVAQIDASPTRQRAVLTAIRRLNDVYSEKAYLVQRKQSIGLLPGDYENVLDLYAIECAETGNKDYTVVLKKRFARSFLRECIEAGCPDVAALTAPLIVRACLAIKNKDAFAVIRAFLKFASVRGITALDFSTLVPRYKRPIKIPETYSEEEILKFEAAINRASDIGKRDYAMLLLATRLGMRSGDIAKLSLDELDFANEKICFIQQKGGEMLDLPMLPEVRNALVDYISVRPKVASNTVFLRHHAPYEGITTSVLRFVTTKYFALANIDVSGRKHGPHAFRSSLASSMVNDNVPYEAVRAILGHSDPDAIQHYARLDIEKLRECAIEVPEPTGSFKAFLEGGQP